VQEIGNLMWSNISFEKKTIKVYRSKVKKWATLLMLDEVADILQRRLDDGLGDECWVFLNRDGDGPRNYSPIAINNAAKRAGIQDWHLHMTRATLLTRLAEADVPLNETQALAGHMSDETTKKYYIKTNREKDAMKALEAYERSRRKVAKKQAKRDDSTDYQPMTKSPDQPN